MNRIDKTNRNITLKYIFYGSQQISTLVRKRKEAIFRKIQVYFLVLNTKKKFSDNF